MVSVDPAAAVIDIAHGSTDYGSNQTLLLHEKPAMALALSCRSIGFLLHLGPWAGNQWQILAAGVADAHSFGNPRQT